VQLEASEYSVLKKIGESKIALSIADIAGTPGCPRDEKTVRKVVKGLIAQGYVQRLGKSNLKITDRGRAVL
jgi:predicted transcriptional regulator